MKYKILFFFFFLIIFNKGFAQVEIPSVENGLELLAEYLEGRFSSNEQEKMDSSYYGITLNMKRIWKNKSSEEELWFYVEQAMSEKIEKPYRQRVYNIIRISDNVFESKVFELNDHDNYINEWKKETPLEDLVPEDLLIKEGCSVFLNLLGDDSFSGKTEGENCPSDIRGAKFMTSEVTISSDSFISWDRGFDKDGKQVWGAVKGPYIFKKEK